MFYVVVTTITGSSSSITNPIVQYYEGALHLVRSGPSGGSAWYYDAASDALRHNGSTSSGMAEALGAFLGEEYTTSGSRSNVTVTIDDVVGKFV